MSADYPKPVFVVACDTVCDGVVPCGTVTIGKVTRWDTHDTERGAQLEIIDDLEMRIRQFKDGDCSFDNIFTDLIVLPADLHADGSLTMEGGSYPAPE